MIFYHFTHPGTVLRITGIGLKPNVRDNNTHMTGGKPVVWLTRQESNIVTAEDVVHMKRLNLLDRKEGDLMCGGTARLSVHLGQHSKKLVRYTDFLKKIDFRFFEAVLTPTALKNWWVYLGEIPSHKIDTSLPASTMLECIDHHIKTHPDEDFRHRLQAERHKIFQLPLDYPVSFCLA